MDIAFSGLGENEPDDRVTMVPPTVVDHRVLVGPVEKERRQDLQLWGWLQALAAGGVLRHPVSISPGEDPPDRYVMTGGTSHPVELTELTVEDMRSRLARVRQVGRMVAQLLADKSASYEHLDSRAVFMADATSDGAVAAGADVRAAARDIAAAVAEDRGYVGEGVDVSAGLPRNWPNTRGFYGEVAGFQVQVNMDAARPSGSPVPVVASSQAEFRLSEARELLWSRVAAKDHERNRVLVMTTGLLDSAGYVCPLDQWLFSALVENGVGDPPVEPRHLDAVVIHHFPSHDVLVAYQRAEAVLPWIASSGPGHGQAMK